MEGHGVVMDIEQARQNDLFRCHICISRPERLLSVRLSRWQTSPFAEDYCSRTCDLRMRFICPTCFGRFHFRHGFLSGFYNHGGKMFRVSMSKPAVEYDREEWTRYIRRHGTAALE